MGAWPAAAPADVLADPAARGDLPPAPPTAAHADGRRAEEGAAAAAAAASTWASAGARPASGPRWMVSKMIIENFEALKSWLSKTLEPM